MLHLSSRKIALRARTEARDRLEAYGADSAAFRLLGKERRQEMNELREPRKSAPDGAGGAGGDRLAHSWRTPGTIEVKKRR